VFLLSFLGLILLGGILLFSPLEFQDVWWPVGILTSICFSSFFVGARAKAEEEFLLIHTFVSEAHIPRLSVLYEVSEKDIFYRIESKRCPDFSAECLIRFFVQSSRFGRDEMGGRIIERYDRLIHEAPVRLRNDGIYPI
jgi:hypothetical protein